mmetsp:Transcript_46410/g.81649  ORF Transcript_46410/g.81649 Transcript_46410/m.81649 type:complete len:275 (+) Transcript_46410:245-1069(+)
MMESSPNIAPSSRVAMNCRPDLASFEEVEVMLRAASFTEIFLDARDLLDSWLLTLNSDLLGGGVCASRKQSAFPLRTTNKASPLSPCRKMFSPFFLLTTGMVLMMASISSAVSDWKSTQFPNVFLKLRSVSGSFSCHGGWNLPFSMGAARMPPLRFLIISVGSCSFSPSESLSGSGSDSVCSSVVVTDSVELETFKLPRPRLPGSSCDILTALTFSLDALLLKLDFPSVVSATVSSHFIVSPASTFLNASFKPSFKLAPLLNPRFASCSASSHR